ncbi:MAG TPA: peptidoglycan-binding domain-containing protein [Anaeromyxobacteraceae bacterium]|nr:peptidoglycan-binding domain-containing protein [Anaeromyxobacteraceae bacterium]
MKRIVLVMAVASLAGCSSRERNYSDTKSSTSSGAAASQDQQAAVIQPSELSNEQVRTVQRSLSERGFAVDPSGTFDDRTQTALMDFQRARGLPATGNLNNPTIEALGIDPRDVMPVHGSRPAPARDTASGSSGTTSSGTGSATDRPGNAPAEPAHPSTQDEPQTGSTDTGSGNIRNPTASPPKPGY